MAALAGQGQLVEVPAGEVGGDLGHAPVGGREDVSAVLSGAGRVDGAGVVGVALPEGHLAHFVSDLVESGALDLSAVYASYEEERGGSRPTYPRLMVKLLVYGYAVGVSSSRKLERATFEDVAVRMLCADQHPDFRSVGLFVFAIEALSGCLCSRCGCAGRRGWSRWGVWRWTGRSCARMPRGTRR